MSFNRTLILDLDGTLCDTRARVHLAQAGQWDEFNALCYGDIPNGDVLEFLKYIDLTLEDVIDVVVVTGRSELHRGKTLAWLSAYNVRVDELLMRPNGDFTPDIALKLRLIETYFGSKETALEKVWLCLDDRDKVVEGLRNYGLPCWQVRPSGY